VDLGKVTAAQKPPNYELLLKVKANNTSLQVLNPILSLHQVVDIEVYCFFFGHKNKAVHVFLHGVLEIVLLKAAVFNMQYSSLFCVVFALK